MLQPVFAAIVAQPQASLPVAGVVHNLDTLLGQGGVVGIKTTRGLLADSPVHGLDIDAVGDE